MAIVWYIYNMPNNAILLLIGPSGAGKSTVSRKLAKQNNSVVIDIEHINFMFVNGFHSHADPNRSKTLTFTSWQQSGEAIGLLAKHLKNTGQNVIIHGHVTDELIRSIEVITNIDFKILLLPTIETTLLRDKVRGDDMTMGDEMVRNHHKYFTDNQFSGFYTLDSTNDSVDQTIETIIELIRL